MLDIWEYNLEDGVSQNTVMTGTDLTAVQSHRYLNQGISSVKWFQWGKSPNIFKPPFTMPHGK